MMVLAVVIPARNEAQTLGELLQRLAGVSVAGYRMVALVVDDGSTDETAQIARANGAVVVSHAYNRGLGAAVRTGLRAAVDEGADAVAYLDADLEYSPEEIPRLVAPVTAGRADYVIGSRFAGGVSRMALHRRLGNAFFTRLVRLLSGQRVTDGQSGMRAFSREAADAAEIIHDYNYAQVLTLDLVRKGFRMEEVAITYRLREHGESFVKWSYPFKVLPAILRELRAP